MKVKEQFNKIKSKNITFNDVFGILIIMFFLLPSIVFKHFNKNIWLFSERGIDARDNGYALFKYEYSKYRVKKWYLIDKTSSDFSKFSKSDKTVQPKSIMHYLIYLFSAVHLSAHVNMDSPNLRATIRLEKKKIIRYQKIFLQHGITKDKVTFCFYETCRANIFICSALREYEFVKDNFGYPQGTVKITGFSRYDYLHSDPKRIILVMPTWRSWMHNYFEKDFIETEYYKTYSSLLSSEQLDLLLNKYNYSLVFYLHHDMQRFSYLFKGNVHIIVATEKNYDVQKLLIESDVLVTDYSSVAFDFAYMNKPIIYYQFDYSTYRSQMYKQGYFDYKNDGFGSVVNNLYELINEMRRILKRKCVMDDLYLERSNSFFLFKDFSNSERIYDVVIKKLFERKSLHYEKK